MDKKPRLIDADALKENLSNRYMHELFPNWKELPTDVKEKIGLLGSTFKQAILNAPTIEAEPVCHSYWRRNGECNNCCEQGLYNGNEEIMRSRWCPHCGAKMDGGKENDRE